MKVTLDLPKERDMLKDLLKLFSSEEPSKEEPSREEPSKEEPSKEEPSKEEPSKEEPSKEEPSKEEPSKEEPSKENATITYNMLFDEFSRLAKEKKHKECRLILDEYKVAKVRDLPENKWSEIYATIKEL